MSPQQILTTVMANIVVDKSTDNAEPLSIFFYHDIQLQRKCLFLKCDQNHDTKRE